MSNHIDKIHKIYEYLFIMHETEEFYSGKIYCANCFHCKLVPAQQVYEEDHVRCAAGKWKKKLGEEKFYKFNTITRRYLDSCDSWEDMGETREFIRDLRKTLTVDVAEE